MNYPAGIIILLLSIIGYVFAWRSFSNQKKIRALYLLVIIGFILRIYLSSDFFLHHWDEQYHALVAKNMMSHPFFPTLYENPIFPYNYSEWSGNHIWVHKQPMTLWTMALSMKLFGVNEIALRLPSILMSTIGIVVIYKLAKHFFNDRIAFMASFLFSINGLIIELTSGRVATDHVDIGFMFYVLLAVYAAIEFAKHQKTYLNILCGLFIAMAILTKWLPALIVLPIWFFALRYYNIYSKKVVLTQGLILLATIIILATPWQIYIHTYFSQEAVWEAKFNRLHITTALDGQSGPFYYYFEKIRLIFGEVTILAILFLGVKLYKQWENSELWFFGIWIFVPLLFFSYVATKMQGYIIFIAPAIFIIGAYFWDYLLEIKNDSKYKWLITLISIAFIILPIRYSIERLKPFEKIERMPVDIVEIKKIGEVFKDDKCVIFNVNNPIETMFYTDFTAYKSLPKPTVLDSLKNVGYTILINENGGECKSYNHLDYTFIKITFE